MVKWTIEDDNGARVVLTIPNTYHVPQLPMRLISPQHLAQELKPMESTPNGTYCLQLARSAKLVWMDRMHTRTVPLSDANVPIFRTAPSFTKLREYESVQKSHERDIQAFPAHFIVPDDDDPVLCRPTHNTPGPLQPPTPGAQETQASSGNQADSSTDTPESTEH